MGSVIGSFIQGYNQQQQVIQENELKKTQVDLLKKKMKLEEDTAEHEQNFRNLIIQRLGQSIAGQAQNIDQGTQQPPVQMPQQQAGLNLGEQPLQTGLRGRMLGSQQPQGGQGFQGLDPGTIALLHMGNISTSGLEPPKPKEVLVRNSDGSITNMSLSPNQTLPKGSEPETEASMSERAVPSLEKDLAAEGKRRGLQGQQLFDWKQAERSKIAQARGQAYVSSRPFPTLDTQNENRPTYATAGQMAANPGRYIPASEGDKVLNKTALIEDIRGALQNTRGSLMKLDAEFSAGMRTKIALALRDRDPQSAISSLINSEAAKELTPSQQDYLINITQLQEQALAMRSVLGAGQGSETLREAVLRTIPSGTTPTKEYGLKQLTQFEGTLDRLSRGVPKLKLRDMPKGKTTKAPKEMTDDEIMQELSK